MARLITFIKDPDSQLDYDVDFTAWLTPISDTISAVVWDVPAALTVVGQSATGLIAKIWVSGGTVGEKYRVTCRITTVGTGGFTRIKDKSFYIRIAER